MNPPDNEIPGSRVKVKGFDPARKPRAVRMRDPEMAGRRERTREGRERKRVREQRPKLFLILASGIVLITLMGLTFWNVLSRKVDREARIERSNMQLDGQLDGQLEAPLDPVPEATPEAEAKPVVPVDREVVEPADSPAAEKAVRTTVSEKQRSLESARDRFLAVPAAGAGDSERAAEGRAEADLETIDEAEKERVLRKVMPFYRSSKKRDAPPVPAEELYIPEKK